MSESELNFEQELEAAIAGDEAVSYFAGIVRGRLEAGVVDSTTYVLEMRRGLDSDELEIDELGLAGELQTDQVVEKLARVERKKTVLMILADELSAPATRSGRPSTFKIGGTPDVQPLETYRAQVRRTMQAFSDEALAYQAGIIVGGIDREELERELERRSTSSEEL